MPSIDVTEALVSPDIAAEQFTVIRRQEVVNDFGESTVLVETSIQIGAVQPGGEQSLLREEGQDAQTKTLNIVTKFRLRGVSKSTSGSRYKPDQINWNGNIYEVKDVTSYSRFGAGFVEATAASIDYVDYPPAELPGYIGRLDFSRIQNTVLARGGRPC
jgi:hypothetical protein